MQKKINSIWLYSIVLFSIALTLILISALAQVNLSPDDEANLSESERLLLASQTAQQTNIALAEANEKLNDDYARLESKYTDSENRVGSYESLFIAAKLLSEEDLPASLEALKTVDTSALSEPAEYWYTDLIQKLEQEGYVIDD